MGSGAVRPILEPPWAGGCGHQAAVGTLQRIMTNPPVMSVAELQEFLDGSFPGPPMPYVIEEITGESIRMRLSIGINNSRPGGTVSGPSLMALADCAAWLVIIGRIGPVALSVTTSLHIDFLRKPALVDVVADGALLKLGKRLAVVEVAMCSVGSDDVMAKAQVTYSIPPR
jgi:acyl-coenzyme A thioesterase PaaI-like protein